MSALFPLPQRVGTHSFSKKWEEKKGEMSGPNKKQIQVKNIFQNILPTLEGLFIAILSEGLGWAWQKNYLWELCQG